MPNPERGSIVADDLSGNITGIEGQVDRILNSAAFLGAPTLSGFLKFITERTLQSRTVEISEYAIATQVFGRGAEFDPASDTIVRTQAYRLRAKLQQYYSGPGAEDTLIVDVPKGHYIPTFRLERPVVMPALPPVGPRPAEPPPSRHGWIKAIAGLLVVAGLCLASWLAGARGSHLTAASKPSPLVTAFWRAFLGDDRQPVVSYSNAQLLGTNRGTLVQFQSGPAGDRGTTFTPAGGPPAETLMDLRSGVGPLYFQDDYTGVGEVLAAVSLSVALAELEERAEVKRSRLISTFDLQSHNVIFLGSSGGNNSVLRELPSPRRFVTRGGSQKWSAQILNMAPETGEAPVYQVERDPATGVIKTDYAIVSVLPGIAPGRRILILGGLLTSGTAAAAAAVTEPQGIAQLASKLGVRDARNPGNWPECFESVWRVKLSRGLDVVSFHLVAARAFKTQP
jgi:hypothetical protein